MAHFLAVFTGSAAASARWDALTDAERKQREAAGLAAWGAWAAQHAPSIVGLSGPLGKTKLVSRDGVSDIRNQLAGFNVVRADSHEAAAALFENHPHFTIFPGEGVEVMPILAIPGA